MKSGTHKSLVASPKQLKMSFFASDTHSKATVASWSSVTPKTSTKKTILDYATPDQVTTAEVLFILRAIDNNQSFNSLDGAAEMLKRMDPDSKVFNHHFRF